MLPIKDYPAHVYLYNRGGGSVLVEISVARKESIGSSRLDLSSFTATLLPKKKGSLSAHFKPAPSVGSFGSRDDWHVAEFEKVNFGDITGAEIMVAGKPFELKIEKR